jgi:hypothetical protein
MYQIEVKQRLVEFRFPPAQGWRVTVDIDAMERANGGSHPEDKAVRARAAEEALRALGARIEKHRVFGRADVVAEHEEHGLWLVEVEGQSSKQKEQAMYSALGQLVLQMRGDPFHAGIAVPDEPAWQMQLSKVPHHARSLLGLSCMLVSSSGWRSAT